MALSATTVAEVLQSAGYATGIFGKWHLGDEDPYQPEQRGFDEVFIHGAGGIGQQFPGSQGDLAGNKYFDPTLKHNGTLVRTKGYCTDIFFQQALGWMRQMHKEEKPFFLYLPTNAPHSPFIVADAYREPYMEACEGNHKLASFYGMITNIDDNMGLLMEKLDAWGLSDNTLLIFMTDNGSAFGAHNNNMRGKKASEHEGGSRVPLFMRWPKVLGAGVDVDVLTRHVDLFPTLAHLAGADLPEGLDLDGRDLTPLLENPNAAWPDRTTFFHVGRWKKDPAEPDSSRTESHADQARYYKFAVRNEAWRLVNGKSLFRVDDPPNQKPNRIKEHPDVVQELMAAYDAWWDEVRPLLINEDASLDAERPFTVLLNKQRASTGLPLWVAPEL